eukprot:TRINITY_DN44672_c0_g1_i1.p1 TRINITY_DN44672_c0_g1~~TRINITY_DN44672_c0_g1_i1.p1  ORF type:complete len:126 (-),score=8.88 TRINITY_DN44672_c0_g1_i1:8-385(-)
MAKAILAVSVLSWRIAYAENCSADSALLQLLALEQSLRSPSATTLPTQGDGNKPESHMRPQMPLSLEGVDVTKDMDISSKYNCSEPEPFPGPFDPCCHHGRCVNSQCECFNGFTGQDCCVMKQIT